MPPYGVAQHCALTYQQLSGPVQHQGSLLLLRLDRNKPHRWPRHCLADRRRIVRVVLATLEIGLHIARWHQLHRVAKGLQLATPVMGRRTGLDADQARLQAGKELQQLRPTDTLANNHRPSRVDAVSLEYRLRNIETDRDNLAHGRLPSKWCASTQPPYGTPMPQSGRRPQHHSLPNCSTSPMSGIGPESRSRRARFIGF